MNATCPNCGCEVPTHCEAIGDYDGLPLVQGGEDRSIEEMMQYVKVGVICAVGMAIVLCAAVVLALVTFPLR
jgi:hypothetical protein